MDKAALYSCSRLTIENGRIQSFEMRFSLNLESPELEHLYFRSATFLIINELKVLNERCKTKEVAV
jgi:hypothetical protein